jgi:RNA polymerase sigma-70 factor (ECF subfamily)
VSETSDRDLLRRITLGDETALRELYEAHGARLLAAARPIVKDAGDAEDVVQEVFVKLWDEPGRYDPERGDVGAFLATWVRNRAKDSLRKEGAYQRAKERASDRLPDVFEPITRADRTGLENALSTLPSEQRTLLEKMYYEGQTQTRIAEDTGLSLGTVKSRIRLGMARLRDSFARFTGRTSMPRVRGQGQRGEAEES